MSIGFRDLIKDILPPWLGKGVGEKLGYVLGLAKDAVMEKLEQGVKARMPKYGTPTALVYIGQDRLIIRGFQELDASYAIRLSQFLDAWARAGAALTELQQLAGYTSPFTPVIRTVSNAGVWDSVNDGKVDGTTINHLRTIDNWDWDSVGPSYWAGGTTPWWTTSAGLVPWFRAWVIIFPPAGLWQAEGTWGDGQTWGDGGVWGCTATLSQIRSLRLVVNQWRDMGIHVPWIIMCFDSTYFDQYLAAGNAKLPDGNFGTWGKIVGGVEVPARFSNSAYIDGPTDGII